MVRKASDKPSAALVCASCGDRIADISGDRRRVRVADGVAARREAETGKVWLVCPRCRGIFFLLGTVALFVSVSDRQP